MELISGLFLWLGDVFGLKWVRQENNGFKKLVKAITFVAVGVIVVMMYFVIVT